MGVHRQYDRVEIGKQFIQYVIDHPNCLTVPGFTSSLEDVNLSADTLYGWKQTDPVFAQYYMKAKELIGLNRQNAMQNDLLDKTIYERNAWRFDTDSKLEWREEKQFEAGLKSDAQQQVSPEQIAQNQAVVDSFRALLSEIKQPQAKEQNKDQNE